MKFVIMAGGTYSEFETPRQLIKINGEAIIARTIRLLLENGVNKDDMFISSNNPAFDTLDIVRKVNPNNTYGSDGIYGNPREGYWMDAFYPMTEACCYLFGDVYYTEQAIKIITSTVCDDHIMFGNIPYWPDCKKYIKGHAEPLGFMIVNHDRLHKAVEELKQMWVNGELKRHPICWEVYCKMNDLPMYPEPLTKTEHFININDMSTDVDHQRDVAAIEYYLEHGTLPPVVKKQPAKKLVQATKPKATNATKKVNKQQKEDNNAQQYYLYF